jgi:hypothetical protein
MAKTWILDTETKGTGANMVPLEDVLCKPGRDDYWFRRSARRRAPAKPEEASPAERHEPHRFRIVDVMSRRVLAADVDARGAVAALEGVRSVVDVDIDVWDPEAGAWRGLTLADRKTLWRYRGAVTGG